ncbi:TonB-dependent receptor domain-containing protein [Haloferula chungangensis]|uniref:TonB-dependent receptor domain-containing protein n=1 Tax=Haloferula chungangensis TaxID=1048331 RepID=A0ABW2L5X6_9BACT
MNLNKFKRSQSVFLPVTCLIASLPLIAVSAEEPEQAELLDHTVVNAEDEPKAEFEADVITSEELEQNQALDLEDIFKDRPDVAVGGGASGGQKIYIRGMEDALFNVEVDGTPQVGTTFHHQSKIGVEPDLLKAIEIRPGVGRATDGFGALGGTVNFVTIDASDMLEPGQNFGGFVRSSYFTNTSGYKENLTLYGNLTEYLSVIGSFSYTNLDDYEDGRGFTLDETSSIQRNGYIKLNGDFQNGHTFSLSYEHFENGGPWGRRANIAGSLLGPAREPGTIVDLGRDTVNFKYDFDNVSNDWVDIEFSAYYTDNTSDFDYVNPAFLDENTSISSLGFDLNNTSLIGDHSVVYGMDFRDDDYEANGWATLANPALYSGKEDSSVFGIYLQDDWQISEQLLLTFGARYDDYEYNDQFGQNFSDSAISPNATLVYSPNACLDFRAGYSQAFRGVLPGEVYLNGAGPAPGLPPSTRNSPFLSPEESESFEVGVDFDNGDFFGTASVFQTTIDNVIAITGNPRTNIGELETIGYDLGLGYRWNGLTLRAGVSESDPTLNGADIDNVLGIAAATGRTWVSSIDYSIPDWGVNLGYDVRYVETLKNSAVIKRSYVVHGLYANWTPSFAEDLTLAVSVDNLFDKAYVDQGSLANGFGYYEPGRDVRLSATYRF